MEYTRLGNSGLKVSRIALGCMSFGEQSRGFSQWSLDEEASQPFFAQAVELGINFWDTANVYSYGSSEEITRTALPWSANWCWTSLTSVANRGTSPGGSSRPTSTKAVPRPCR